MLGVVSALFEQDMIGVTRNDRVSNNEVTSIIFFIRLIFSVLLISLIQRSSSEYDTLAAVVCACIYVQVFIINVHSAVDSGTADRQIE